MKGASITEITDFIQLHHSEEVCLRLNEAAKAVVHVVENLDTSKQIDGIDLEIIIRSVLLSNPGEFGDDYIRILSDMDTPIGVLDCVYNLQILDGETPDKHIDRIASSDDHNLIFAKVGILKNEITRIPTTRKLEAIKKLLHAAPIAKIIQQAASLSPDGYMERIK